MTGVANAKECPKNWTAGLDWFRWKQEGPRDHRDTIEAIRVLQYEDAQRGSNVRPWFFQGWKGFASESVRWGVRDWSLIWETSGDQTASTVTRLRPSRGSAKRIDLQLTLNFSSEQRDFGDLSLRWPSRSKSPLPSTGVLLGRSTQTKGLYVGTVGKRTSPSYWRLYDKGVESKKSKPGYMWRLELETKSTHAEDLWTTHQLGIADPQFCAKYCVSSWKAQGRSWPVGGFDDIISIVPPRKPEPASKAKLMSWVWTTVNPVMRRLLTVYTAEELLLACGLSDVATPRRLNDA